MENKTYDTDKLVSAVLSLGAYKANVIDVSDVQFDVRFRDMCASNACGQYGRCWTCPPDVGEIHETIDEIKQYRKVMVYQTVGELEDSYDFETMVEVGNGHNVRVQQVRALFETEKITDAIHLGAGGCRICEVCAKKTDEPCRYPDLALKSLEAYVVNVSKLAEAADMKYINGQNTVTYFGAVFFG